MNEIPWHQLGIPEDLRSNLSPSAPRSAWIAAARGEIPAYPDVQLAMMYVSAASGDPELRGLAVEAVRALPNLKEAVHSRTHAKVLEFVAEYAPSEAMDWVLARHKNANDRTAALVAARAGPDLAEAMADDHERLLITPDVLVSLHGNPNTSQPAIDRATAFLRMQGCLPALPSARGSAPPADKPSAPPPAAEFDLDAEIEAALAGKPSPALQSRQNLSMFDLDKLGDQGTVSGFAFDFKSDDTFSLDLLEDGGSDTPPEVRQSIEKRIAAMSPGKKIKLAYLGNKESRAVLIRDRNKQVAAAVVKSGRMTDNEALNAAGNRNMHMDVLREIASNREWMRNYPVKVAVVNNPRTPPSVAVPLVSSLQKRELEALARNRNVSSVVFTLASKMVRQKQAGQEKEKGG